MKEYGLLEMKAVITFSEVSENDTDALETLVYNKISALGNCTVSTEVTEVDDTDVRILAQIETPAVREYVRPSWDDYGGNPGCDEIDSNIDSRSIEDAFDSGVYVRIENEEFIAA